MLQVSAAGHAILGKKMPTSETATLLENNHPDERIRMGTAPKETRSSCFGIFGGAVTATVDATVGAATATGEGIKAVGAKTVDVALNPVTAVSDATSATVGGVVDGVTAVANKTVDVATNPVGAVTDAASAVGNGTVGLATGAADLTVGVATAVAETTADVSMGVVNDTVTAATAVVDVTTASIDATLELLGVNAAFQSVFGAVRQLVSIPRAVGPRGSAPCLRVTVAHPSVHRLALPLSSAGPRQVRRGPRGSV